MLNKFLIFLFLLCCGFYCRAEVVDNLDNATYVTAVLNSSVTANGNSTVSMKRTATGDCVVNWRGSSSYYLKIRNYQDRVEITPTAAINSGQYSLYILFFNSSKQFISEVQFADARGSTDVQILKSVSRLAAQNNITNAEYFYVRFRLHGEVNSGFIFDKIHVKEGPGYWKPTTLTQAAPKTVFVHEMTGFRTPQYSGSWGGWNYNSHNPNVLDANGKPDIASVYYPSVGYYDMKDPCLVEYHCQIMKMAGVGGVIFDLAYYQMDTDTVNMITGYLNIMGQYGLKAVICYEDKAHWIWDSSATTRATALARAYQDMNNWLNLFISSGTQYYVTGTRPLFMMFSYETEVSGKGISCLSPAEITTWLNTFPSANKPVIMRQWFKDPEHIGVLNGQYGWPKLYTAPAGMSPYVGYCDMADNNDTLYDARDFGQYLLKNSYADFYMPGVWPGFNDYAVWGWGSGPRLMPRYDGRLYDTTWDYAIDDNLPVVQVATWNDWFEGTIIEPSVEFGNLYIQKTFLNVAEFKNNSNSPVPDFNVPIWIYKIRDISDNAQVLADMQTASEYIKTGQYEQAEYIVSFWAKFFDVDSVKYWTGEGSLTAYQPGDYSHDGKVNFKDLVLIGLDWQNGYGIRDLDVVADNWLCE
jgi:glycoprotein endo-alpha-1,2-mannosidase